MRQEKRKKKGGEKARSKSQDCCVPFKPKNYLQILLSAYARTSEADILHLGQKAARCSTCKPGGEEQTNESEESSQVEDDGTTLEDIKRATSLLALAIWCQPSFTLNKSLAINMGKDDENLDQDVILKFIQAKLAGATQCQTESYLKPLLRKLKHKKTPRDILAFLTIIIMSLLEREYVKANDSYLQMAIGNAPWPIGVSMVGIHARTGREKIFSQNVAHVLNDETQRKYIQSKGFPVSLLHWDKKGKRYRLKSGSGTCMVTGDTKENMIAEASAHFKLRDQILVFQDGKEVPENFNISSYTQTKMIKYPSRAKAGERLYLLHASEKKEDKRAADAQHHLWGFK
ncbi:unnamed protein product [Porites lobata]|uniref:Pre-mRNA-splicing factor 18 n=1 Tax=Porites lobata TaxID=104759 RepID=A0ABN8RN12_9CNID|nr:unnamed protein product [Porites lobata]